MLFLLLSLDLIQTLDYTTGLQQKAKQAELAALVHGVAVRVPAHLPRPWPHLHLLRRQAAVKIQTKFSDWVQG